MKIRQTHTESFGKILRDYLEKPNALVNILFSSKVGPEMYKKGFDTSKMTWLDMESIDKILIGHELLEKIHDQEFWINIKNGKVYQVLYGLKELVLDVTDNQDTLHIVYTDSEKNMYSRSMYEFFNKFVPHNG